MRFEATLRNPYEFDDDANFDYTFLYIKKCQAALLIVANQLQLQNQEFEYVLNLFVISGCIKKSEYFLLIFICSFGPTKATLAPLERLLQGLAAPSPPSPSLASTPASLPPSVSHPLTFSLQLLALPMAQKLREGLQLVVQNFPQVAFEYARQFCRQPAHWAMLLDELLLVSKGSTGGGVGVVYEQILEYLTGNMEPEAFLNLLPGRGHLLYFLPYPSSASKGRAGQGMDKPSTHPTEQNL